MKKRIRHAALAFWGNNVKESVVLSADRRAKKRLSFVLSIIVIITVTFNFISCKKWAETPVPTDKIADNAVFSNDATATAVLTGIYSSMNTEPIQGSLSNGSISLFAGLSADEFKLANGISVQNYLDHYQNSLSQSDPSKNSGAEHWALFYKFIFKANAAIIGLNSSQADGLNSTVKQQLLGEAKFIRAFFYFYLVNEFGDVPLTLTTDPHAITLLPRMGKDKVYDQIISDLIDAEDKLSSNYLDVTLLKTTAERIRPTKWAADALLARVYLYTGDWSKAEEKATSVINNATQFSLSPINSVFLKNSKEAIWQIQPTDINFNTQDGRTLIIPVTGPSTGGSTQNPVFLSPYLFNSFEVGDKRAIFGNWIDTTIYKLPNGKNDTVAYPFKYKINSSPSVTSPTAMSEYFIVLRLAEQYLIRAEARVKLGNVGGSQSDLNAIRNRAGLPNTAANQSSLLAAILHERQVELFSEWGHRWFDLKRTGNIDTVMSVVTPQKANGASWKSYQQWYPIPMEALTTSPNLIQTDGY